MQCTGRVSGSESQHGTLLALAGVLRLPTPPVVTVAVLCGPASLAPGMAGVWGLCWVGSGPVLWVLLGPVCVCLSPAPPPLWLVLAALFFCVTIVTPSSGARLNPFCEIRQA